MDKAIDEFMKSPKSMRRSEMNKFRNSATANVQLANQNSSGSSLGL